LVKHILAPEWEKTLLLFCLPAWSLRTLTEVNGQSSHIFDADMRQARDEPEDVPALLRRFGSFWQRLECDHILDVGEDLAAGRLR
jgi:hypothetical protein